MSYRDTPLGGVAAYAPASDGPFRCDRCRFQDRLFCHQPDMVRESKEIRNAPANATVVRVEGAGCCDYFKPKTPR